MSVFNEMTNSSAIGLFDSGIGGLSIARKVRDLLPSENILYVADASLKEQCLTRGATMVFGSPDEAEKVLIETFQHQQWVKAANKIVGTESC